MNEQKYTHPDRIPFDEWVADYKIECVAGRTELKRIECEVIYDNNLYVCNSTSIYQMNFSQAQNRFYATKLASYKGLAKRGRFYVLSGEQIYKLTDGQVNLI